MRILIVAATYPPTRCGVGDYVRRVARELRADGDEVYVLTGEAEDEEHDHGDLTKGTVDPRPAPSPRPVPVFERDGWGVHVARVVETWDWSALDWIDAALAAVGPDVVSLQYHGEDYLLHPAVCAVPDLARTRGRTTVTTLHNLQQPMQWDDDSDPLDHLLRRSAAWICTNTIDERRLREHQRAREALHVVSTGPCITDEVGRRDVPVGGPLRVGYFGFLSPFKGVEYLLRAAARLRSEGVDVQLEIAAGIHTDAPGRLRDYARTIEEEIERAALGDALHRRGFVSEDEVTALLHRLHVAVFPFRQGVSGKNSSFWSTLHHGTPTLTTRGPGLPEGLVDGQTTMLVPVDDVDALAARLRWADTHRDELEAIGRRGRAFVSETFEWSGLARRMHAVFAAAAGVEAEEGEAR